MPTFQTMRYAFPGHPCGLIHCLWLYIEHLKSRLDKLCHVLPGQTGFKIYTGLTWIRLSDINLYESINACNSFLWCAPIYCDGYSLAANKLKSTAPFLTCIYIMTYRLTWSQVHKYIDNYFCNMLALYTFLLNMLFQTFVIMPLHQ